MNELKSSISANQLNIIFPFFFTFNKDLKITEVGVGMEKLAPNSIGKNIVDFLKFKRPFSTKYEFFNILEYSKQIFIIQILQNSVLIKGQIIFLEEQESILFLGSPWLASIEEMEAKQLLITDFALHDSIPDMLQVLKSQEIVMNDIKQLVAELNHQKQKLQESESRLLLQYSISQVLASSNTFQVTLEQIIKIICNHIGWKCGAYWVADKNDTNLNCIAYWQNENFDNFEFKLNTLDRTFRKGEGLPGRVWESSKFIWIPDVEIDPNFPRAPLATKINLHGAFSFPILINQQFLGLLEFFNTEVHEPDSKLIQLFETSSNQIGQYILKVHANLIVTESEKRYKELVEEASDIIYRTDFKGNFIYANPIATRIMLMDENTILTKHFTDLIRFDYKEKAVLFYQNQFLNKTLNSYFEFPALNGNNEEVWLGQNVRIILDGDKVSGFQAVARDITQRKRIDSELIQAKEIAEHSKKIKEQFLANMSHEIRTPMNAIIGMTDILLNQKVSEEQKECIDVIKLSADNLLTIINDILDFSKIESGKIVFEENAFSLVEVLAGVIQTLENTANSKNITLSFNLDPQIPLYLLGDKVRLRQILLNLISNSIKFTAVGFVVVTVSLHILENESCELLFEVSDTGVGISEEQMNSIFESFTQASNDTTRKFGGTGLGLTIAKQLIELQGGQIKVRSQINKGSCFYFYLKFNFTTQDQAATQIEETHIVMEYSDLAHVSILLAEDNIFNQMVAQKVFENWNCTIEIADNGVIALEKVKQGNYDIVLMDIQMPEMDGYETAIQIRKLPNEKANTPIIAMTAHAMVDEEEKCLSYGMNDYISKPFNQNELFDKILMIVTNRNI